MENEINDPELLILITLEAENTSMGNLLLASITEIEKFTVKDSLPKIDQERYSKKARRII